MRILFAIAVALAVPPASSGAAVLGADAAVCASGTGPAVLVRIDGFKARTGKLRVQVYGGDPGKWLAKGQKLRRIEVPVTRSGIMDVCIAVPGQGRYAIAVRHDIDGSGKSGWNDGGGFSRNPRLSLFSLKPKFDDVVITVGDAPKPVDVVLNYRSGLSIKPGPRS